VYDPHVPPEIDFHAAGSLWASRATLVSTFEVGKWHCVLFRAHPEDVESVLGRLACEVSSAGRFCGLVFVRSQQPQLLGTIFTADGARAIESAEFTGSVAELEATVKRELLRATPPPASTRSAP
jgi:hypothetical protein